MGRTFSEGHRASYMDTRSKGKGYLPRRESNGHTLGWCYRGADWRLYAEQRTRVRRVSLRPARDEEVGMGASRQCGGALHDPVGETAVGYGGRGRRRAGGGEFYGKTRSRERQHRIRSKVSPCSTVMKERIWEGGRGGEGGSTIQRDVGWRKRVDERRARRLGLAGCGRRQLVQHGNREPRTPPARSQPKRVRPGGQEHAR